MQTKPIMNLIYKIKNKLFRFSREAEKLKKPKYNELLKYKLYILKPTNNFILSFGAGRCGQNWFAKLFNSHPNWIGTCERFPDFEAFYRYINFYNLPINKENFFRFFELVRNRDLAKYQNTLIASPYFAYGVEELNSKLNPKYLIFNLRNPINSVESFYRKGWFLDYETNKEKAFKKPFINTSNNLTRSFSRIIPSDEFFDEWIHLSRIGKITWFWANTNRCIFESLNKINNIEKLFFKLEDIDRNYDFYKHISKKFNFEQKLTKYKFYNVINKAPNKGPSDKYRYKDWNNNEKKEFQSIIDKFFPHYDNIRSNF